MVSFPYSSGTRLGKVQRSLNQWVNCLGPDLVFIHHLPQSLSSSSLHPKMEGKGLVHLMFYWYHNETRITDEDSHRMITLLSEDNATRVASSILMVTNVTRNDGGLYRCSVFNRNITDSNTATTFVTVYCKWSALVTSNVNAWKIFTSEYSGQSPSVSNKWAKASFL